MILSRERPPPSPRPGTGRARAQLLAVALGGLPLYSGALVMHLRRDQPISTGGFIFYLAVISPLTVIIAFLLLRFVCGEHPRDLNLKPGKVPADLFAALFLSVLILVANIVSTALLSGLLPESPPDPSVRMLFTEVAGDPALLLLLVGLLVPAGAASEEVVRVFLLSRLWKVWPSIPAKLAAAAVSAGLFGLSHLYQGPVGTIRASLIGLILALYYLRSGRALPLIVAHYLTNSIQLLVFVARTP